MEGSAVLIYMHDRCSFSLLYLLCYVHKLADDISERLFQWILDISFVLPSRNIQ